MKGQYEFDSRIEDLPNGRSADDPDCCGPNVDHRRLAPATAAELLEKPPSLYVAPPTESMIVLPYVCWQVAMSALEIEVS